jgi:hypothetical protein
VPLTPPLGSKTQEEIPLIKSDSIEIIELNKIDSPIIRLKKQMKETLTSPESETSSHVTSTTSSSGHLDVERIEKVEGSSSESGVKEAQTSYETASSGSILCSPPSDQRKSSDSSHDDRKIVSPENENVSLKISKFKTFSN